MKFNFRLQRVLEFREREESEAQVQFQQAKALTHQALEQLEGMYQAIDHSRQFAQNQVLSSNNDASHYLQAADDFARLQQVRIQRQRELIRSLKEDEELKQDRLVKATVDKKAIEKLREKAFAEFKEQSRKREDKVLDDLVSSRHRRGFGLNSDKRDL